MLRIIIIAVLLFALAGGTWQARGFFSPAPNSVQANLGAASFKAEVPESAIASALDALSVPIIEGNLNISLKETK